MQFCYIGTMWNVKFNGIKSKDIYLTDIFSVYTGHIF